MTRRFAATEGGNSRLIGAHAKSEESAGWISVTDSLLLGFGVMMCVAIASAAASRSALSARDLLAADRDDARQRLLVAEAENLKSQSRLAALTDDERMTLEERERQEVRRQRLEGEVASLRASRDDLSSQRDALMQEKAAAQLKNAELLNQLDAVRKSEMSLRTALVAAEGRLAEADANVKTMSEEVRNLQALIESARSARDLLQVERDKSESANRLATQRREQDEAASVRAQAELKRTVERQRQVVAQRDEAIASQKQISAQLAVMKARLEAIEREASTVAAREKTLSVEIAALREANEELGVFANSTREREVGLRRELVGFKGRLNKVAFVVDGSESMGKDAIRWPNAKKTVLSWIENLDVEECVVIVFTNLVHRFPEESHETFKLRGPQRSASIERIRSSLNQRRPVGYTNTCGALQAAYAMPGVDTIILFTDGAPFSGQKDRAWVRTADGLHDYEPKQMDAIYALCSDTRHLGIPVNVVGVGDFYSPEFSGFLLKVAKITNGTFIGR